MWKTNLLLASVFVSSILVERAEAQGRSFAGCDYSQGIVFVMEDNRIVWTHEAKESNDIWVLPDGHLLFTTGKGVLEMNRQNDTLFHYASESPIFACQRLRNGNTFIGECNKGRLLEVSPAGQIVKEVCILSAGVTDGGFAFMRNARRLDNGHYLVAHYGDERVTEYDADGKVVWNVPVPGGPHSVIRQPNGHTLVSVADKTQDPRLVELDAEGRTVWEFSNKDVPDHSLKFLGGMQCLPDGKILFTNWVGHVNPEERAHLFLIDKEKHILHTLRNHEGIQTMSSVYSLDAVGDKSTYRNPVIDYSLPDPTVIKADDGFYYLYATENIRNVPIHRSRNLVDWEEIGTSFTDQTRPTFEPEGNIWAPDINRVDGQYVMYYSMSVWGGEWTCGIGIATATSPAGPFTDRGMLFRSNGIGVQNSIDPFYIEEKGRKYLFWGSFRGIYGIELASDGLSVKKDAKPRQIAGTAYEGTYIHKKDGYYYLFASIGSCCEGIKSTYTTVVGRSNHLFGPYVDKQGRPMLENHHEVLIHANDAFVGTGHNSEIVADEAGNDWVFYHAVDKKNPVGRVLMLDRIDWQTGWPVVNTSSPALEADRPVFRHIH